ncbi:hypothetical protein JCGZ_06248 [Jatropha curcas]|uniref:Thionin-like protein n=1 Tax=Jatropha curcas TaxID=180498 RepID=A0A067KM51_JATCU|nr:hypothetical protein JCGZ_06248 [Jatropha curcas]
MERKILSFVLMCLVIGMLVRQPMAKFDKTRFTYCLENCLIDCVVAGPWFNSCPPRCVLKCLIHPPALPSPPSPPHARKIVNAENIQNQIQIQSHILQFCTIGCATSKCSDLISKDNYRLDEVAACIDNCSKGCEKN